MKPNVNEVKKVPCEIYSRVCGYYRPIKNWNAGKKQEFKDRRNFSIDNYRGANAV